MSGDALSDVIRSAHGFAPVVVEQGVVSALYADQFSGCALHGLGNPVPVVRTAHCQVTPVGREQRRGDLAPVEKRCQPNAGDVLVDAPRQSESPERLRDNEVERLSSFCRVEFDTCSIKSCGVACA